MNKGGIRLRTGYTTGTCAAAATKGAALMLTEGFGKNIEIGLPGGEKAVLPMHNCGREGSDAFCEIIKDAGDDPDITNGALIRATVKPVLTEGIFISGGEGVGVVTRPGLAVPPGKPAINPVPESMIRNSVRDALKLFKGAEVIISVAGGAELAKKTLNSRLGIVGGISILGTTGLVIPYSHEAYRESIQCSLDVMRAMGVDCAVLCTGRSSEKEARRTLPEIPEAAFVLMADYFDFAVREAAGHGINKIIIAGFPGKLLKMAAGAACTHYRKSAIDLDHLSHIARNAGLPHDVAAELSRAHTVRHAFEMLSEKHLQQLLPLLTRRVAERAREISQRSLQIEVILLSYSGDLLYYEKHD
jgi:cobalt-precorrin-5B (C1)-methyltransferase